mgnify:CR=1 FL=1
MDRKQNETGRDRSGFYDSDFAYRETFEEELKKVLTSGRIQKVYLDIDRMDGQVVSVVQTGWKPS